MKLILRMEDGSVQEFGIGDSVQSVIRAIGNRDVEKIIVGVTVKGKVDWEKQFDAITVMPSSFGKPRR